jgi:outer membrane protein
MKLLLKGLIAAALLCGFLTVPAFGQTRIATVDLRKVFDGYWKTKQADAALKERVAELDKDHKSLLDGYKKARDEAQKLTLDAGDQAVSAQERDRRKKLAEDKLRDLKEMEDNIKQFEAQAQTTMQEQRRRMRDNILKEVLTALNGKAKTGNFTMVLDSAALTISETPVLLYSTGENDLTEVLLTQMNATAPVDAPKADDKKPEEKKPLDKKPEPKK